MTVTQRPDAQHESWELHGPRLVYLNRRTWEYAIAEIPDHPELDRWEAFTEAAYKIERYRLIQSLANLVQDAWLRRYSV